MLKARAMAVLAAVLPGCVTPAATWKGAVEWPDEHSARLTVPAMDAGAALAAAAAVREMIRTNPHPHLFSGCSSPEQGLDVAVYTGPTPGLYYVALEERFDRCGGPRGRVLDWWYVYAVTPQGEVVGEAPSPASEAPVDAPSLPDPLPPAQPPPPAAPPQSEAGGAPAQPPPPVPAAPTPSGAPPPPSPEDS
jgi:hypothetical protein